MAFSRRNVALLIESSRAYGRGVLHGIARYVDTHRNWSVYLQSRAPEDAPPPWLESWRGDGIIARVEDDRMRRAIESTGLPAVDVRGVLELDMPLVETNDRTVAQLAYDHLVERGFERFAFCGLEAANYSVRRLRYFRELVESDGRTCHVLKTPVPQVAGLSLREHHAVLYARQVLDWLALLPRPIGLMACNDVFGQQVLNACRELKIAVPEEIAVIGVDDDELHCELSDPPLSSVAPDTHRIGYLAAELLDRMMEGEACESKKTFVEPLGVSMRQSTEVLAIDDAVVARALRFIRAHACDEIGVGDVVKHAAVSRRMLERRFRDQLDRSPSEEILRVRLKRARELIAGTELPLRQVARMCGFKHPEYMSYVFRKHLQQRPSDIRAAHATGGK